jgi:dihydrofolate reductase
MTTQACLHIIAAMTRDGLIGSAGRLPWTLPEEMKIFRDLTMGHTVIMGRKTFAGIGAPLEGRYNIVISSEDLPVGGLERFTTLADGLKRAGEIGQKTFCIGGVEIYRAALPHATHLHISWIDGSYVGDIFFPDFDLNEWVEISRQPHDGFTYSTYQRKREQNQPVPLNP